jgi:hypothetical protein
MARALRLDIAPVALRRSALIRIDSAETENIPLRAKLARIPSHSAKSEHDGTVCRLVANSFDYA